MAGGATVGVKGKQKGRQDAALRGTSADRPRLRGVLPELHPLSPVGQEVCNPPAGVVRHLQCREPTLQNRWQDGVERRAEVQEQDSGVGPCSVQMFQDVV